MPWLAPALGTLRDSEEMENVVANSRRMIIHVKEKKKTTTQVEMGPVKEIEIANQKKKGSIKTCRCVNPVR